MWRALCVLFAQIAYLTTIDPSIAWRLLRGFWSLRETHAPCSSATIPTVNRFGLNSSGHAVVRPRLASRDRSVPGAVGVNLASNTGSTNAIADYVAGVAELGTVG